MLAALVYPHDLNIHRVDRPISLREGSRQTALARLAKIVHAADVAADSDTDPLAPGLLAIGIGGLNVESDDQVLLNRGMFVYDALYAWCVRQVETTPAE